VTVRGAPSRTRMVVIAGAVAALASAMIPPAPLLGAGSAVAQPAETISWSIDGAGQANDGRDVQLTVDRRSAGDHSTWSSRRSITELRGISIAALTGSPQPVRFELSREAGRLVCTGIAGRSTGSGSCSFSADAGFATYLEARGIGRPDPQQSYSLAMSGVGRDLVEALDKGGFAKPTVTQLTAMGIHGATADYVRTLAGIGYHLSADDLISFKIHGVEPDYILGFAAMGPSLRQISPSDLVSLRIHGVKPEFVRELMAIGPAFRNVTADDLVSMAIHGVRPDLARAFMVYQGGSLRSDDLVAMAIHGVTASYIERLAALGYRGLSADDLVSMRIHGVTPDYVQSLQGAGMPRISADQLVRLRLSGFAGRRN
jgi:hypothetical protein